MKSSLQCNCQNGYTRSSFEASIENCVDIDECSGTNICDENAECTNEPGGYTCRCRIGFYGNGYQCQSIDPSPIGQYSETNYDRENNHEDRNEEHNEEHIEDHRENSAENDDNLQGTYYGDIIEGKGDKENVAAASPSPNVPSLAPDHWLCDQCSQYAECNRGICTCRPGFRGDGTVCDSVCAEGDAWIVDRCQPTYSDVDDEG